MTEYRYHDKGINAVRRFAERTCDGGWLGRAGIFDAVFLFAVLRFWWHEKSGIELKRLRGQCRPDIARLR